LDPGSSRRLTKQMKKTNLDKSTSLKFNKETLAVLSLRKLEAVHGALPPNTGLSACQHTCDSAVICG
jgi:hypothetical protein